MSLTLWNWILVFFIAVCGIGIAIGCFFDDHKKAAYVVGAIGIAIAVGLMFFLNWFNTSTASGARSYKDWKSNINNGIDRVITVTAEDGREVYRYEGKCDIESDHTDNYIKFETQEGKRVILYYGIQDTVAIIEK